ncbi:unnamed protein product [Chrysoparadoxa australica]
MAEVPRKAVRRLYSSSKSRRKGSVADSTGPIFVVRFTADGKYCLSAGADRTVRLWSPGKDDPDSGRISVSGPVRPGHVDHSRVPCALPIKAYSGPHGYEIRDISVTGDNTKFASCGADKVAFLWDVSKGSVVRRFQGHEDKLNTCCFNKDCTVLFTGSYDGTIRCWDLRSNNRIPIQVLHESRDSVTCVRMSSSGEELLSGSVDGRVRTYDIRAGRVTEDNLKSPVTWVSISNDGNCVLASCLSEHACLRLLEKHTGTALNHYTGHTNSMYGVESCFSNDDACVMSGSEDGSIRIWDLVDAKVIRKLQGHSKTVCSIAYNPKQSMLISSSYDGTALVWA